MAKSSLATVVRIPCPARCGRMGVLLAVWLGVAIAGMAAPADPVLLQPEDAAIRVDSQMDFLADAEGELAVRGLVAEHNERFSTDRPDLTAGGAEAVVWRRFRFRPPPGRARRYLVEVLDPRFPPAAFFHAEANRPLVSGAGEGALDTLPHRYPLFQLDTAPERADSLFFRLPPGTRTPPIILWSEDDFLEAAQSRQFGWGGFYGGLLFLGVVTLAIGLISREHMPGLLGVLLLSETLCLASLCGFAGVLLWPDASRLRDGGPWALGAAALVFAALFARRFLNLKENAPKADRIVQGVAAADLMLVALAALVPGVGGAFVLMVVAFLNLGVLVFAGVSTLSTEPAPARYLLVAVGITAFALLAQAAISSRNLVAVGSPLFALETGLAAQMLVLGYAHASIRRTRGKRRETLLYDRLEEARQTFLRGEELELSNHELTAESRRRAEKLAHLNTEIESARKKADRMGQRYQNILEDAPDAIFVVDAAEQQIIDVNFQAEELLQLPREDLIGKQLEKIHPPDKAARYVNLITSHVESGLALNEPLEIIRGEGERVPVEVTPCILKTEDESIIQAFYRNASGDVKAHSEFARLQRRVRFMTDHVPGWISLFKSDGAIAFWNAEATRITGVPEEEIVGRNLDYLFTALIPDTEERERVSGCLLATFEGGETDGEFTFSVQARDGQRRRLRALVRPMPSREDKTGLAGLFCVDASEIEGVRAELSKSRRTNKAIQSKVDDALAENRSLMDSAASFLNEIPRDAERFLERLFLTTETLVGEAGLGKLDALRDEADNLRQTLAAPLRREIEQRASVPLNTSRFDLNKLATAAVHLNTKAAQEKGVGLELKKDLPVAFEGDNARLLEALSHVVARAVRSTPSGKHVRVLLERAAQQRAVRFIVRDQSEGVRVADLPRLFDPLASFPGESGGPPLPLDLAVSRRLIERHGGILRADLGDSGQGVIVTITFPIGEAPAQSPSAPAAS